MKIFPIPAVSGTNELTADFVRDAIREMVELQLREDRPPEVGLNVERLVAQGFLREEALSRAMFNPDPLEKLGAKKPFVVSLSNHEWPFDKLRANGFGANGLFGFNALDTGQAFDAPGYAAALSRLPAVPWDNNRPPLAKGENKPEPVKET